MRPIENSANGVPDRPPRRRGAVLMTALVGLTLALILLGSLIGIASAGRGRVRMEERRLQAEWLAESGLERAAMKLGAAPGYPGETWEVPAADLGGRDGAVVRIAVEPVDGRPRRRLVHVSADYPRDEPRRARHSRTAAVDLGPDAERTTGGGR